MNNFSRFLIFTVFGFFVFNFCFLTAQQFYIPQKIVKVGIWEGKRYEYIANDLIIILKDPMLNQSILKSILKKYDAKIVLDFDKDGCGVIRLPENKIEFAVAKELEKEKHIKSVEPVQVGRLHFSPNDPKFVNGKQWNLDNYGQSPPGGTSGADINIKGAWNITRGENSILVAVLDSGLPLDANGNLWHEDLNENRITIGTNFTGHGTIKDQRGHGTHVLGIISAETDNNEGIAGIAHNCSFIVHKAGDDDGSTYEPWIKQAIDQAVEDGAKVINCSFSFPDSSQYLKKAIENAFNNNVTIVASAGNYEEYFGYEVQYPAKYSVDFNNVIAVAATDHNDIRSTFSCYGPSVNIAAPGGYGVPYFDGNDILSTFPPYEFILQWYYSYLDIDYDYLAGTSMAAPQVTGLVALILSLNDNLTPLQVRNVVENTADDVSNNIGHGRINAFEALKNIVVNYFEVSGTISSNTTWSGHKYVSDNVTVNSGVTLTFNPGTTILFNNGKKITINGQLIANGTESSPIRFTSLSENPSPGDWYGLKIYGSNASVNLNYCEIDYAQRGIWTYYSTDVSVTNSTISNNYYGIYAYKSIADIQSCSIKNNSTHGIYLYRTNEVSGRSDLLNNLIYSTGSGTGIYMYKSSPETRVNEIKNVSTGLRCLYYSSPRLGKLDYYGNNNVHNVLIGLDAVDHSNPFLGLQDCDINGGYNQFTDNSAGHVWADKYCEIDAEQNWWGAYPPDENMFDAFDHSSIDYTPSLPGPVFNKSAPQNNPEEELFDLAMSGNMAEKNFEDLGVMQYYDTNWSIKRKLIFARALLFLGYSQEPVSICEEIIEQYPDSTGSHFALDLLWQTAIDNNKYGDYSFASFTNYLGKYSHENKSSGISGYMRLISAGFDEKNEIQLIDEILKDYNDPILSQSALFQKFMFYLNDKEDKIAAETVFSEMNSKYPNSSLTRIADQELKAESSSNAKPSARDNSIARKNSAPANYELFNNFPNPFNPSTTIRYSLPTSSNISSEIYNSVGQKIRDFDLTGQDAGTYEIIWHGKNNAGLDMPSGLYILKFNAQSLEEHNNTFSKSIKLLLIR